MRGAYLLGRDHPLKFLLRQNDAAHLTRALVYNRHVTQARIARIKETARDTKEVADLETALREEKVDLATLQAEAQRRTAEIGILQQERATEIARLGAELKEHGAPQDLVAQEAQHLTRLTDEVDQALRTAGPIEPPPSGSPVDERRPFASRRGHLKWPVQGQQAPTLAGTKGAGVRIAVRPGTPVGAVAPGRLVFASWFRSFGFLAIVDHGAGYLSLYGNNQKFLKAPGDWVESHDPLALAGRSGGRVEPSLYFEIRQQGQVEDLGPWFRGGK
jgi:septal ring factor EnvC (AmiA/AmiB activator)